LFDIEAFHNVLINLSAFDRVSDEVIKRVPNAAAIGAFVVPKIDPDDVAKHRQAEEEFDGSPTFGMTVNRTSGSTYDDTTRMDSLLALDLLRTVVNELGNRRSPVPALQTMEVVRIVEAANKSFKKRALVAIER